MHQQSSGGGSLTGQHPQNHPEWPAHVRIPSQDGAAHLMDMTRGVVSGSQQHLMLDPRGSGQQLADWPVVHRGQFASVMGGTLGRQHPVGVGQHAAAGQRVPNVHLPPDIRGGRSGGGHGQYPLYHTCERPSGKKRVTIVEDNNTESSV